MSVATVPDRDAGEDRSAAAAAALARRWVGWYAGFVGTEAAERRRAEIDSDLWEQRADARETGRRSFAVAGSIAWRVVGGMPDDLLWVRTQRLAMRGQRADRKASAMNSLGHTLARWWWVAGAAVLAAFFLYVGIDNLVGEYAPLPEGAVQCFAAVALLVGGIALRVKAPRLSAALIAAPALPAMSLWWAWPVAVLGALVAIGAIAEIVRLSRPGAAPRIGAVLGTLLLGVAVIAPALGFEPGPQGDRLVFVSLAVLCAAAGIVLLVLTRRPAAQPAEPRRKSPTLVA